MFSARFTVKGDIGTGNVTVKPREAEKDGDDLQDAWDEGGYEAVRKLQREMKTKGR